MYVHCAVWNTTPDRCVGWRWCEGSRVDIQGRQCGEWRVDTQSDYCVVQTRETGPAGVYRGAVQLPVQCTVHCTPHHTTQQRQHPSLTATSYIQLLTRLLAISQIFPDTVPRYPHKCWHVWPVYNTHSTPAPAPAPPRWRADCIWWAALRQSCQQSGESGGG